jgi:hypothetical protein
VRRWAALALVALAGCGGGDDGPPPRGPIELEALQRFEGFRLYWLGEEFEGLPVSYAEDVPKQTAKPESIGVQVEYGNCDPPRPRGQCAAPLSVRSVCAQRVERHDVPTRKTSVRGVPGRVVGSNELEVYTGNVIVTITARDERRLERAARAMRPLNAREAAGRPLAPPTYDTTLGPRTEPGEGPAPPPPGPSETCPERPEVTQ